MLGFIRLVSGSVTMNEVPIDPRRAFPISVGAIIEHPGFMNDMSGHDNLLALGQIRSQLDDEAIHAVMTRVGLPDDKKPVATYSLGTHDLLWLQSLADQIFELSNGKLQQVEDVV